jgi:hypothetical protein
MLYISTVGPQILLKSQSFVVLLVVCVTKWKDVSKHSEVEEAEKWLPEPKKKM